MSCVISATFNSCKQVSNPSTGTMVMDLMCGSWGAYRCTSSKWYQFMGTKSNFVPFQINYRNQTKPGFINLNPPTIPCSKSIDVSIEDTVYYLLIDYHSCNSIIKNSFE